MSNLFMTLMVAFILLIFAIALLAIGWLIKSKTKIEGTCAHPSSQPEGEDCHSGCECHPSKPSKNG